MPQPTIERLLRIVLKRKIAELHAAYDIILEQEEEIDRIYGVDDEAITGLILQRDEALAEVRKLTESKSSPRKCGAYYIVLKDDYDQTIAALAELRRLKRSDAQGNRYSAAGVSLIPSDIAAGFIGIAEAALADGKEVDFTAACAVALKRELDVAKARIAELEKPAEKLPKVVWPSFDFLHEPTSLQDLLDAEIRSQKTVDTSKYLFMISTDSK